MGVTLQFQETVPLCQGYIRDVNGLRGFLFAACNMSAGLLTHKNSRELTKIAATGLFPPSHAAGSSEMINQWIELVQQKNTLVTEESDLMVA